MHIMENEYHWTLYIESSFTWFQGCVFFVCLFLVFLSLPFNLLYLLSGAFLVAQMSKNMPANAGDSGLMLGWGRSPGDGNGSPFQYSCLKNPMDRGTWLATVHGVVKSQTWLSDFPFTFHFHALEKEMATHSSVLAWRIPGAGKPGGLPSMGSHTTEVT